VSYIRDSAPLGSRYNSRAHAQYTVLVGPIFSLKPVRFAVKRARGIFESRIEANSEAWRRRWDSNPRLDPARPEPSASVLCVLKKRTARPQISIEIRYCAPVLLSILLSEKIFSCETIRAMITPSEMRMSLYFAAWIHRTTAPPEQRLHPGP
jgi:hypothetical protein